MEMFRWVLVVAGVLLLGVAYLLGRKKRPSVNVYNRAVPKSYDPSVDELSVPISDPILDRGHVELSEQENLDESRLQRSAEYDDQYTGQRYEDHNQRPIEAGINNDFLDEDFSEEELTDDSPHVERRSTSFAGAVKQVQAQDLQSDDSTDGFDENFYTGEFETYSEPVLTEGVSTGVEEKLVTIHVAASPDRRFYGKDIKNLFDKHGYQFGAMSLYHCMLENDKVFSIANMVKPGTFNEQEMDSFETPGITLFMRLPIELDSDVAFDFLVREARELASELDGQLRDSNRNPLSEQTIQHMREDVQQYVFRTRRPLQSS